MQTMKRNLFKLAAVLVLIAAMFGAGIAPVQRAAAACLPTVSIDLYAKTGSSVLVGATAVPIWGYSLTPGGAATLPGPVLSVNQGDCVQVTLHNGLTEASALLFQGQSIIPDTSGAAAGGSKVYTFNATVPGTFLYEAGLVPGSQHQTAMGMYGALVVEPSVASPYDVKKTLVLSEVDPILAANPVGFDMRKYAPKFFLINGMAYPNTDLLANQLGVDAGDVVLLRYVNAGLQAHAMSTLGVAQKVIAVDGSSLAHPHVMVAETIAPGQTLDTVVSIPVAAAAGAKYALYDANLLLRNSNASGLGGMLTFLTVVNGSTGSSGPDIIGPILSSLTLTPNPSNGATNVVVAFNANDTTTGNNNVTGGEYWVDGNAVHTPISVSGPAGPVQNLSASIAAPFTHGAHVVSVRAQDALGNWSATANINLIADNVAPVTSGLSLTPNPSNGSLAVSFTFTGSDSAGGNNNITAAEYWVDAGAAQPAAVISPAPTKIFTVSLLPPFTVGTHTVSARTQDAVGNWSLPATITLVVDQAGPITSGVSAAPNPNNGSLPLNTSVPAVRVSATFNDSASGSSNIVAAEVFIDIPGATGTGLTFVASPVTVDPANDGVFNTPIETGYADIPLPVVGTLATGSHPLCVHAKDSSGNWGAMNCTTNLVIDRTAPTVTSITRADANPAFNGSVHFLVTFSESVSGVAAANFSIVRTGLTGTSAITSVTGGGSAWIVTVTTGTGTGTLGLNLTAATGIKDLAGNAMTNAGLPLVGQVYNIIPAPQPSLYFSTTGNTNPAGVGGTADDADIYFFNTSTTSFSRSIDVTAISNPLPTGANVDGFKRVNATQFYMSFTGTVTIALPGPDLTVQDEDVVLYNAGAWSLYYDGSVNGVTDNVDAISIVGGNLYLSLATNTTPPGAGGTGDDADLYRWNGGSSYTRVIDASTIGVPSSGGGNANVDGFVFVDATHFYMSFSNDTTLTGPGAVQDEDVVYYNNGVWSVYFDGTALGLGTSGNLDIDAFDLP